MPKMDPVRQAMKDLRDMIHAQNSFLITDQCRAWIRADIRKRLLNQLASLEYRVDLLHAELKRAPK